MITQIHDLLVNSLSQLSLYYLWEQLFENCTNYIKSWHSLLHTEGSKTHSSNSPSLIYPVEALIIIDPLLCHMINLHILIRGGYNTIEFNQIYDAFKFKKILYTIYYINCYYNCNYRWKFDASQSMI